MDQFAPPGYATLNSQGARDRKNGQQRTPLGLD